MAAVFKTPGQITSTLAKAEGSAAAAKVTAATPFIVSGQLISTGAPYQRAFPNIYILKQWLSTASASDVEIQNVTPISVFTS